MPTIDTMRFKVNSFETDDYGKRKLVEIKTPITNISGQMLIDHPANKADWFAASLSDIYK